MIRIQRVCVIGTKSHWLNVKQGVPQRTIIGPLFFLMYVNGMINYCYPTPGTIQYASDRLIFQADRNPSISSEAIERQIECPYSYLENKIATECIENRILDSQQTRQPRNFEIVN